MKKDIVIIGTAGFATETLWILQELNALSNEWNILGFVGDKKETVLDGYEIIGDDNWLYEYPHKIHAVCGIGNVQIKKKIIQKMVNNPNIHYPAIISPHARIWNREDIGPGSIINHLSVVSVNVKIGAHVVINLHTTIGHQTIISDFCNASPCCSISGNVYLEEGVELGSNCSIIPGVRIGKFAVIGANAAVVRNIEPYTTAVGVPAKPINK